jgi:hypothetical protein
MEEKAKPAVTRVTALARKIILVFIKNSAHKVLARDAGQNDTMSDNVEQRGISYKAHAELGKNELLLRP